MEKDTLVLEVCGEEEELVRYQQTLVEAASVGIDRVFFCNIWDGIEEKIEKSFFELMKSCQNLGILPLSSSAGYYGKMFEEPMVGCSDKNGDINCACEWSSFSDYKRSKEFISANSTVNKPFMKTQ